MFRVSLSTMLVLFCAISDSAQDRSAQEIQDLFSLVLVTSDLQDANKLMTIYDPNEDGSIDSSEQSKLEWKKDVSKYDLNRDGKLTHLEVAVRFAELRRESDITLFDRKNANLWMGRKDTNRNGQLDPDEIAKGWPDTPEDFDTNNDGIISLAEMAAQFAFRRGLRRQMGIEAVDQTGAINLVDRFDTDQDRKLSADEWANANLPREGALHDEDHDGVLTIMELATLLAKHRQTSGMSKSDLFKSRQMIARADLDQDGKLNQAEQKLFADENVGQYDTNGDGFVTQAEIDASLAKARKDKGYLDEDLFAARRLMTRHDQNRNMMIDKSELAENPTAGQLSVDDLRIIDQDRDEAISLEELAKQIAKDRKEKS